MRKLAALVSQAQAALKKTWLSLKNKLKALKEALKS
jgi:hypothetical protein